RPQRVVGTVAEAPFAVAARGRAVAVGQLEDIAPADGEPPLLGDGGRVGQQVPADRRVGADVLAQVAHVVLTCCRGRSRPTGPARWRGRRALLPRATAWPV